MTKKPPNQEAFDKLLAWLDPDREKAGEKYAKIQLRLIKLFGCNGCSEPEQLADQTFDVVSQKIDWLMTNYVGDPMLYFCGVARNVLKEDRRKRVGGNALPPPVENVEDNEGEKAFECLDHCMEELPHQNRRLVLSYYEEEGHAKIVQRRKLAEELGITLQALRLRVFHARLQLRACMETCLRQSPAH